jgi:hypothetical protein
MKNDAHLKVHIMLPEVSKIKVTLHDYYHQILLALAVNLYSSRKKPPASKTTLQAAHVMTLSAPDKRTRAHG